MSRAARILFAVLSLFGVLAAPALAHELGALSVTIMISDAGACRIEATVDTEHLPPSAKPFPAAEFMRESALLADGVALPLALVPEPSITSAAGAELLHFSAETPLPAGTREIQWRQPIALGQYLLTLNHSNNTEPMTQWIEGTATGAPIELSHAAEPRPMIETIAQYLWLGFTHIVPHGLDHMLFVFALFLLSPSPRALLAQVTAFTLAHSLTLALAMKGIATVPGSIVEPLIALSIAWMALENVFTKKCRPSRTALVFGFGLLHGLGFAGVLSELGIPEGQFLPALASFNVGVEAGQLAIVLLAYIGLARPWGHRLWYRSRVVIPASLLIAAVGGYWTIERAFFG